MKQAVSFLFLFGASWTGAPTPGVSTSYSSNGRATNVPTVPISHLDLPQTVDILECHKLLKMADKDRNSLLDEQEYVLFVHQIVRHMHQLSNHTPPVSDQEWGNTLDQMPPSIQLLYKNLNQGGAIEIVGYREEPTIQLSLVQELFLIKVCVHTEVVVHQVLNKGGEQAYVIPEVGVVTVYSSFQLSNKVGLTSQNLDSGTNRKGLDMAYQNLVTQVVSQKVGKPLTLPTTPSTKSTEREFTRRLTITVDPKLPELYRVDDTPCPGQVPNALRTEWCQTAYGKFPLYLLGEDELAIYDEYSQGIQSAINQGNLQNILEQVAPDAEVKVVDAGQTILPPPPTLAPPLGVTENDSWVAIPEEPFFALVGGEPNFATFFSGNGNRLLAKLLRPTGSEIRLYEWQPAPTNFWLQKASIVPLTSDYGGSLGMAVSHDGLAFMVVMKDQPEIEVFDFSWANFDRFQNGYKIQESEFELEDGSTAKEVLSFPQSGFALAMNADGSRIAYNVEIADGAHSYRKNYALRVLERRVSPTTNETVYEQLGEHIVLKYDDYSMDQRNCVMEMDRSGTFISLGCSESPGRASLSLQFRYDEGLSTFTQRKASPIPGNLSPNGLLFAGYMEEEDKHLVRLFEFNTQADNWMPIQDIAAPIQEDGTSFGATFSGPNLKGGSVDWSEDGRTIAISAVSEKRISNPEEPDIKLYGTVYIYEQSSCEVGVCPFLPIGEVPCQGSWCGRPVKLASDGQSILVGALFDYTPALLRYERQGHIGVTDDAADATPSSPSPTREAFSELFKPVTVGNATLLNTNQPSPSPTGNDSDLILLSSSPPTAVFSEIFQLEAENASFLGTTTGQPSESPMPTLLEASPSASPSGNQSESPTDALSQPFQPIKAQDEDIAMTLDGEDDETEVIVDEPRSASFLHQWVEPVAVAVGFWLSYSIL